jgi:glycosyltransferase involved in cell wall biosynthesis
MSSTVLHIYRTYFPDPPGGLQEAIRQIALATQAHGVANSVFALSPKPIPKQLHAPEAKVVRSRSWVAPASCDLGGIASFTTFSRLAKGVDMLHYHFPWPFADVLNVVSRSGRPATMTYHSDIVRQRWLGKVYAPLMWRTLRQMRIIVATSPAYKATSLVLSHPQIRDKVRVIPLGIVEDSYPKYVDGAVFARLGIGADEPFFLFIGVLRYYKGAHFLIRAALGLRAKVVIAGSGPERETLQNLCKEIGADNVIFAGQVSDAEKVSLLKNCRALVLPSHLRSEAFGMVLVEAAMFGKPLISCEIGTGTSYVNAHEVTGFVVEPQVPARLAWAMNCLLQDDHLAQAMGTAARARYDELFSGPALGKAYADVFREALA